MSATICSLNSRVDKMSRNLIISNIILFQIGWFACVLGGANQYPVIGALIAVAVIALHILRAASPKPEALLVLAALAIGVVFESLLTLSGLSIYPSGVLIDGFAPYWMVLMWGLFATTLNVSMRWLTALPMLWVGLLGAILAPLSYLGGNRLGAVEFSDTTTALMAIALGWAVLLPLIAFIAKRYDGYADGHSSISETRSHTHV